MTRISKIVVVAAILSGLLSTACPLNKRADSDVRPIGPDVRADLVIYFKTTITPDEINAFSKDVLSLPDPKGRGYYNPPGVRTVLRIYPPLKGHEGIAVTFFPTATKEERENLKRSVDSSPIVYKVFQNVAPAELKKID
ncbi:MAG TPA: hypothetical protein VN956_09175 [Pyrinomonadaceae bacterium]|nr:hypothetical protein [Pyrinomonadaceae bacterium]